MNLNLKLLTPYLIGSIPFAFLGGSLTINKIIFEILLFMVLLCVSEKSVNNILLIFFLCRKSANVII